eukprot:SAG31_NODE_3641_length_4033_cov_2.280376_2_plen_63_part_00
MRVLGMSESFFVSREREAQASRSALGDVTQRVDPDAMLMRCEGADHTPRIGDILYNIFWVIL